MKKYVKGKSGKNQTGPGFRTSDHFKGSIFSGGGKSKYGTSKANFNPAQFKTQHKG